MYVKTLSVVKELCQEETLGGLLQQRAWKRVREGLCAGDCANHGQEEAIMKSRWRGLADHGGSSASLYLY